MRPKRERAEHGRGIGGAQGQQHGVGGVYRGLVVGRDPTRQTVPRHARHPGWAAARRAARAAPRGDSTMAAFGSTPHRPVTMASAIYPTPITAS
ncbi:hypothetical protein [Micropruina glycogenica]|uniref:hypothetical protein n=1 Tax=Micropruina glycogenica TaxID=75385 RepID=UPI001319BB05|nr:hypothetical protein [Micropruina glycogenica]